MSREGIESFDKIMNCQLLDRYNLTDRKIPAITVKGREIRFTFPSTNQLATVPPTSASPTPTGNATDIPATAIAAERRMFEALKTMPPRNGHTHCDVELDLRFSTKLHAQPPDDPIVNPARSEKRTSPIT